MINFSFFSKVSEFPSPDLKTQRASSNASSNGSELSANPEDGPYPISVAPCSTFGISVAFPSSAPFLPSLSSMKNLLISKFLLKKRTISGSLAAVFPIFFFTLSFKKFRVTGWC